MSDESAVIPARSRDILGRRQSGEREPPIKREPTVKLYDFKRPDKFSKEQVRTVEIVHETFARLAVTSLSARLRLPCDVTLTMVDQLTFQEFTDSLSAPTALGIFSAKPWEGSALLHVDTDLREALLERSFGGPVGPVGPVGTVESVGTVDSTVAARELTDLEHAVMSCLMEPLVENFKVAWEQIETLEPALRSLETDPRFCQVVPPTEMILLVGFEVKLGDRVGQLKLVIPYLLIEPVVYKLNAEYWYSSANPPPEGIRIAPAVVRAVEVPAELLAAGGRLSIGELRALRKGSLVPVPGMDEGIARLRAGGVEVATFRLPKPRRDGSLELEFIVDGPDSRSDLAGVGAPGGETGLERSLAGLERGLAGLREGFEGSMKLLGSRLGELEGRQESLADRLAFGGADEAEQKPFASLASVPAELISAFFAVERPQATALILAWLDDALASRVLDGFEPELQTEVIRRVAVLDWVSPGALKEMDRVLTKKLIAVGKDSSAPGGVPKVVGLLNLTQRATEKNVIESLDRLDPVLSEEIKKRMFVFEDISLLDDESIALLLARATEEDLVLSLKPLDRTMRERVLARADKATAARLLARVEAMGRVRLSECDAAGQRVVEIVRRLEEEGLIMIAREDEAV
jgi:flagellar motor switch protein FliM